MVCGMAAIVSRSATVCQVATLILTRGSLVANSRTMANDDRPPSAVALRAVMREGGELAATIRGKFHRITRWKWTAGRRKPDAASLTWLHDVTAGRVAADGWLTDAERGRTTTTEEDDHAA